MVPPLLYPLLALISGLLWPFPPLLPALWFVVAALAFTFLVFQKCRYLPAPALFILAFYLFGSQLSPAHALEAIKWKPGKQTWHAQVLEGSKALAGGGLRLTAAISPGASLPAVPVLVTVQGSKARAKKGDHILFEGSIKGIKNRHNPGERNRERAMAHKGIQGQSTVYKAEKFAVLPQNKLSPWETWLSHSRTHLANFLNTASMGSRPILLAVILGDRSQLSEDLRTAFSQSGLAHVLAISGLHVTGMALLIQSLMRMLLLRIRPLPHGVVAWTAALVGLSFAATYAAIAGMPTSAKRALVMSVCLLLSRAGGRRTAPLGALCLAAILLLLFSPQSLWDLGFQLSFSSVAALILFSPKAWQHSETKVITSPWLAKLRTAFMTLTTYSYTSVGASLSATLGTAPLIAYTFHGLSLVSPISNLVGVLVLGTLAVPLGVASCSLHLLGARGIDGILLDLCAWLIEGGTHIATFFGNDEIFPYLQVWPSLYATCLAASLLATAALLRLKERYLALTMVLLTSLFVLWHWQTRPLKPPSLTLTQLAVGHGDSLLMQVDGDQNILVDGGGPAFPGANAFDPGEFIVVPALKNMGVSKVDIMIVSHPDNDHLGGLLAVARVFPVGELWLADPKSGGFQDMLEPAHRRYKQTLEKLISTVEDQGGMVRWLSKGDHRELGPVTFKVLHPSIDWPPKDAPARAKSVNNGSLVLSVAVGPWRTLLTGDIEKDAEQRLLQDTKNLGADVLKIAHHGSPTSSSAAFLRAVSPSVALLSVGPGKRFNLPNDGVLERVNSVASHLLRSDHAAHQVRFYEDKMGLFQYQSGSGWKNVKWHYLPCEGLSVPEGLNSQASL